MKYNIKIKNLTKEILKVKTFYTKCEADEFMQDYGINTSILIKNEWYKIRGKRVMNNNSFLLVTKEEK